MLLKKMYSDSTVDEVLEDEEVCASFFGTVENAANCLNSVQQYEWNGW